MHGPERVFFLKEDYSWKEAGSGGVLSLPSLRLIRFDNQYHSVLSLVGVVLIAQPQALFRYSDRFTFYSRILQETNSPDIAHKLLMKLNTV